MADKLIDRTRTIAPEQGADVPPPFLADDSHPGDYIMDAGLEDAANAAVDLGQPLLLTGDPGTGKTRFAHHLAWQLGLGKPLEFHTKSTSQATDLFYTYDAMRRFHKGNSSGAEDEWNYIHFNALGLAVLMSLGKATAMERYGIAHEKVADKPRRAVVLIDEIDKAPRDFPNDLLHEISSMSFRIAELNKEIAADKRFRPVVVVTSNRERPLPDAFLRRCVFYNIRNPDAKQLTEILARRFRSPGAGGESSSGGDTEARAAPALFSSAVTLFNEVQNRFARPPSTSELISWVHALLRNGADLDKPLAASAGLALRLAPILAKNSDDQRVMSELLGA